MDRCIPNNESKVKWCKANIKSLQYLSPRHNKHTFKDFFKFIKFGWLHFEFISSWENCIQVIFLRNILQYVRLTNLTCRSVSFLTLVKTFQFNFLIIYIHRYINMQISNWKKMNNHKHFCVSWCWQHCHYSWYWLFHQLYKEVNKNVYSK